MLHSINADRAEELRKMGFPCKSFEVLYSDRDVKSMSPEIKEYLTKLVQEEDVLIGVHRTGKADLDDIANILKSGLIVNSLNGGNTATPIHLMNTVSYYPNNETILKEVINADVYKDGQGDPITVEQTGVIAFLRDEENVKAYFGDREAWEIVNPRERTVIHGEQADLGFAVDPHANAWVFYIA